MSGTSRGEWRDPIPTYPDRGAVPWDELLKAYIDYGDVGSESGPPGPEGPPGLPGIPGGDTVQSIWTWEIAPASPPMDQGLIGALDPPPREATELITSCFDLRAIDHSETLQALQPGDRIYLQVPNNPDSWHVYELTGLPVDQGASTYTIPVETYSGSPPDTAPNAPITVLTAFQFLPRPGPPGPPGPQGPPGPPGSGEGGFYAYVHNQLTPASVWTVIHNLGVYPSVTVVDSGDSVIVPDIHYDNSSQVTIRFGSSTSGKAYFN